MWFDLRAVLVSDKVTIAAVTTYTAGGGSSLAWFAGIDWLAATGVVIALMGLLMNFYFLRKRYQLEEWKAVADVEGSDCENCPAIKAADRRRS